MAAAAGVDAAPPEGAEARVGAEAGVAEHAAARAVAARAVEAMAAVARVAVAKAAAATAEVASAAKCVLPSGQVQMPPQSPSVESCSVTGAGQPGASGWGGDGEGGSDGDGDGGGGEGGGEGGGTGGGDTPTPWWSAPALAALTRSLASVRP